MSFRKYDLTRKGCDPSVKSGLLDEAEFTRALAACGIFMSTKEIAALNREFGDETTYPGQRLIQYEVFGESLREGMSQRRASLISKVYRKVDAFLPVSMEAHHITGVLKENKAPMTMEFLLEHYHAHMHPMVRANEMTDDEAMRQMKDGLENGPMDADGDGIVDEDEFLAFYEDISAGIPSDEYFCYVAECVWNIHENPDANPLITYKREVPRTTPATKSALFQETVRLNERASPIVNSPRNYS